MAKLIDEVVKGLGPDKELHATDFIDLTKAAYVTANDKVDLFHGSNDRAFAALSKKIKDQIGDKPVIVAAADAVHYNYVNRNMSWYHIDYIQPNAKTWIQGQNGEKWGKPVQLNHETDVENTVGRVLASTPFIYPGKTSNESYPQASVKSSVLYKPDGHIELIYYVSDKDAIERIVDGRFRTMSVGQGANPQTVYCSPILYWLFQSIV